MSKQFNLKRFLTGTISFGAVHSSLICMVLIPFFKDSGMLPLQLSMLLLMKKLVRLVSDSVFGMLFDKFGAKPVFLLGRTLKLCSYFFLLAKPSFLTFSIAVLLSGVSYSAVYGKVGTFIYNTLSANGCVEKYSRAMSIYYFVMDILLASMSFISGAVLKMYGYDIVIYVSIVMNLITICIIIKVVPNAKTSNLKKFVSKSFKDIWKTIFLLAKTKPQFLYLLMFYGVMNFLSWQMGPVASMVLLDMGYTGIGVANIGAICKISMAVGCLIPMFIKPKGIKVIDCCKIFVGFATFALITAITYNSYLIIVFMCGIILAYTTIEVSIEKTLDKVSDPKIRGTAISLAMTFCTIFTSSSIAVTGLIAQYANHHIAYFSIIFFFFLLSLFLTFKLRGIDKL